MRKYLIIDFEFQRRKDSVIFYAAPILSGQHAGKYATSENALKEFPEIFENEPYEVADLDPKAFQIDTTPPTLSNKAVIIPEYWEAFFAEDKFICGNFVVELIRINGSLAVDISYLTWEAFQNELDAEYNKDLKRTLMPIWDYVLNQIEQGKTIDYE